MSAIRRLALIATLLAIVSACGTSATPPGTSAGANAGTSGQTTLSLWIFEGEETFLPELEAAFEAEHPAINLEITQIPEDQYVTKIDTALAANAPPDIGFVYGGQKRWLKSDKFLPLDELFQANDIDVADFNQNAMSLYCEYEGSHYCIGSYTGAVLLFYNKDMFDAAGIPYPSATEPMTVDEYAALAGQLANRSDDINQRVWGGSAGSTYWYMDWATHFSEDGASAEGYVNDDPTVHTYRTMAQMVADGVAPSGNDLLAIGGTDSSGLLAQQKLAMAITDNIAAIPLLEAQNIRYGAAPPPVEQAGDEPFIITWTDAFGVFSQSQHPEEAKEFLAFLATAGNRLRVESVDVLPLNMQLAEELNWAEANEGRAEALAATSLAREVIFVPGFYEITGPVEDAFNLMVEEQADPEAAMDEAALQIQDSLDKVWETWNNIQ